MTLPIRTAVFCGDAWHPEEIIREGLRPLASAGFAFDWRTDRATWAAPFTDCPVAILAKGNTNSPADRSAWMTPEIERAFLEHTQRGGGVLMVHGGTAGYRDNAMLRQLTGGAFLQHPPPCAVTVEPVAGTHPIIAGVQSFAVTDEHYVMALDDPKAEVFLHTRSEHGVQPAGWTRQEGRGRVCALTPGHTREVWLHDSFQLLLRNSLRWIAEN